MTTDRMTKFITNIPKIVVSLLLVAAIINLLIGVFLRYVMIPVTDWLDVDSIRFTWVEEVGEMMLAWLTLIGAAIGVRERSHFTLHVLTHNWSRRPVDRRAHPSCADRDSARSPPGTASSSACSTTRW